MDKLYGYDVKYIVYNLHDYTLFDIFATLQVLLALVNISREYEKQVRFRNNNRGRNISDGW